jgi:hypothetical protein
MDADKFDAAMNKMLMDDEHWRGKGRPIMS